MVANIVRLGVLLGLGIIAASARPAGAYTSTGASYTVIDSEETTGNPPPFAWDDPSAAAPLTLTATFPPFSGLDEGYASVPIPWSFTFFGVTYTSVFAVSNGYVQFGGTPAALEIDTAIPTTFVPINIVAAIWADLDGSASGGSIRSEVLGAPPNRRLVISWVNFAFFAGTGTEVMTFQITLYEAGGANSIRVQYLMMTGTGTDGSGGPAGIQDAAGGLAYENPDLTGTTPVTPPGNTLYSGLAVGYFPTGSTPGWAGGGGGGGGGGGSGPGGASRDNDNGDQGINDLFCSGAATSAAGLVGLALALAVALAALRRS